MGRVNSKKRSSQIKQKKQRHKNLLKLKKLYQKTKDKNELRSRLAKVAPWINVDDFIKKINFAEK